MSKKTVALIGLDPATIDFTKPDYTRFAHLGPNGQRALIEKDRAVLAGLGFHAEPVFVPADVAAARAIAARALASKHWDCVLISNGVRSIPSNFLLLEALVNAVLEHAPRTRLCFTTKPDDGAEAVQRWITP